MRNIIRCPSCFTYVYADARTCHGCGERIGRRRLLTRGSWIFIGLALTTFVVARAIDLQQDVRIRARQEVERERRRELTHGFLREFLTSDLDDAGRYGCKKEIFSAELKKLRDRYPTVLPADSLVDSVRIKEGDYYQHHTQEKGKGISHSSWNRTDSSVRRRASCVPTSGASSSYQRMVDGVTKTSKSWTLEVAKFEAEFLKDGKRYAMQGSLCVDQGRVSCLTIDRIEGVNDLEEIEPQE